MYKLCPFCAHECPQRLIDIFLVLRIPLRFPVQLSFSRLRGGGGGAEPKTNGFSCCSLAAGALQWLPEDATLKKHNKVAGGSVQSNRTEHDRRRRRVCNLEESQWSTSLLLGTRQGSDSPPEVKASVSFTRITFAFQERKVGRQSVPDRPPGHRRRC